MLKRFGLGWCCSLVWCGVVVTPRWKQMRLLILLVGVSVTSPNITQHSSGACTWGTVPCLPRQPHHSTPNIPFHSNQTWLIEIVRRRNGMLDIWCMLVVFGSTAEPRYGTYSKHGGRVLVTIPRQHTHKRKHARHVLCLATTQRNK
ncbi:hypothetical protein QBC46DRAFT_128510 [Diplogelasinospora grovesii]|uniref:Uncharacterized protein n=1 Tax=Diplogelasinospora grovesii TaxID=303347 RepID=A0AAN6S4J1_9PEZI|nr:hypothetical protein QBC46DRAFT_128510 [Diplogelasinospora grovesii]